MDKRSGSTNPEPREPWLDKRQAAAHLGVTTRTIENWQKHDGLPHAKSPAGSQCFYRRTELDAWLRQAHHTDARELCPVSDELLDEADHRAATQRLIANALHAPAARLRELADLFDEACHALNEDALGALSGANEVAREVRALLDVLDLGE
ncbi:AlpA family transcriptional regulator [Conexibacter sp. SYSU D00693]|uniref:helix-turn-helix transcriptional regulator n=1 Tax=Conexibacter sp. SYSU D00693 TaxID=2812560 RepID=UPI00196A5016|nr:helix-turn-helix domain-containing protein [Conexibacter sp. SYSU D00693]